MANHLGSNPLRVDTAGTIIEKNPEGVQIQAMQWCDDGSAAGGAITIGDDLEMKVNGADVNINASSVWPEVWTTAFTSPIRIWELIVSKIDGGSLYIWRA